MDIMKIKEEIQVVFRDVFEDDTIVINDKMTADDIEDWDSLTHIQLLLAAEKKFKVKFTTDEILKLKNVGEFVSIIEMKLMD